MSTEDQAVRWQKKFDRDYPKGLLATWDDLRTEDGNAPRHVYLCPRVEVTGMDGLNPVVMLPVPGWEKVVQPGAVESYQITQTSPKVAKVTFAGGRSMSWGAGVNKAQAQATDEDRKIALAEFARTGRSFWAHQPEEEGEPE